MIPENKPKEDWSYLTDAIRWVRERGGLGPCADSVLTLTAGDETPEVVKDALRKAGAPVGVYGLLNATLYEKSRG